MVFPPSTVFDTVLTVFGLDGSRACLINGFEVFLVGFDVFLTVGVGGFDTLLVVTVSGFDTTFDISLGGMISSDITGCCCCC